MAAEGSISQRSEVCGNTQGQRHVECFIFFCFFLGAFLKSIRGESVGMRKPNDVMRMVMGCCDACGEKGEKET